MKRLPVVVIICAVALGGYTSGQDKPVVVGKPVSTIVAVGGQMYRCVAVLNENFSPVGAAWTPVEQ